MKFKEEFGPLDGVIARCITAAIGGFILAFGLYNVHALSNVTEGGALGLTLFFDHWFNISPAVSGLVINVLCYAFGWRVLGMKFVAYSIVSTASFSGSYALCECFDPVWPQIAEMPLVAAIVGALFVGVGVGLCVRIGGAPTGDDALAMGLSKKTGVKIQWAYLATDLTVLALSASYIPLERLGFSLLTVFLSGQIIGFVEQVRIPWRKAGE